MDDLRSIQCIVFEEAFRENLFYIACLFIILRRIITHKEKFGTRKSTVRTAKFMKKKAELILQ